MPGSRIGGRRRFLCPPGALQRPRGVGENAAQWTFPRTSFSANKKILIYFGRAWRLLLGCHKPSSVIMFIHLTSSQTQLDFYLSFFFLCPIDFCRLRDWLVISCSLDLRSSPLLNADRRPTLSRSDEKNLEVEERHMVSDSLFRRRLFLNVLHRS